jgi:hypothetical protein
VFAPDILYLKSPESLIWIFDLRIPGGPAALDRQRHALRHNSRTEILDEDHRALIVYPGWVAEPAR